MSDIPEHLLALIAVIIASMFLVGTSEYEDALADQEVYCKNVSDGVWPDYKGLYAEACE
jgi:hypothetical protein